MTIFIPPSFTIAKAKSNIGKFFPAEIAADIKTLITKVTSKLDNNEEQAVYLVSEFLRCSLNNTEDGTHYLQDSIPTNVLPLLKDFVQKNLEKFESSDNSHMLFLAGYFHHRRIGTPEQNLEKAFKYYEAAGKAGHAKALFEIGVCHTDGIGTEQNLTKAKDSFQKAANKGHILAQIHLTDPYVVAQTLNDKPKKVQKLFALTVNATNATTPLETCILGIAYEEFAKKEENPLTKNDDLKSALTSYRKALPNSIAQYRLGLCHLNGTGVEANPKTAVDYFTRSAKQGNPLAQHHLALCLRKGLGVEKNLTESIKWCKAAAELSLAEAQVHLGLLHQLGSSLPLNLEMAVKYFERAAKANNPNALYHLGLCCEEGKGIEKNLKNAADFYKDAATLGHIEAQFAFGVCLEGGKGIQKNLEEAAKCYKKIADRGYAKAQLALGICLEEGKGIKKDPKQAMQLFEAVATATKGPHSMEPHSIAKYKLALCYKDGKGVDQNMSLAVKWLVAAIDVNIEMKAKIAKSIMAIKPNPAVTDNSLSKDDIIKIMNADLGAEYTARLANPKSNFIGDLVAANKQKLNLEDLKEIKETLPKSSANSLGKIEDIIKEKKFATSGIRIDLNVPSFVKKTTTATKSGIESSSTDDHIALIIDSEETQQSSTTDRPLKSKKDPKDHVVVSIPTSSMAPTTNSTTSIKPNKGSHNIV